MKKVLVLYYSQAGQLKKVIDSFTSNLPDDEIQVDFREIKPKRPYPFPWPFYEFFDEFPESVLMDGCEINEVENIENDYDLIILGYTVWYMSPSIPVTAFMQSKQAKQIFKDKPVITLIACRDMWVLAQEKMKKLIENVGGKLIDNVALTDQGKGAYSLVTLPRYLLTGKSNAFLFFPPAGILESEIKAASRFGDRLNKALKEDKEKTGEALLKNLGAVNIDGKLIATEKIANRSFQVWTRLIKLSGKKYSFGRKITITIYAAFLILLLLTVVPINVIIGKIMSKFRKDEINSLEDYYEQPSGR
ncbi:MAG: dialkylresorcinol condensing enzyme [Thiovulaceae bacterium]|nr:dialkylresorcinol condensing enzyme [Sulfurimonadaceae bacterium]